VLGDRADRPVRCYRALLDIGENWRMHDRVCAHFTTEPAEVRRFIDRCTTTPQPRFVLADAA
jgi:hypothetical protein